MDTAVSAKKRGQGRRKSTGNFIVNGKQRSITYNHRALTLCKTGYQLAYKIDMQIMIILRINTKSGRRFTIYASPAWKDAFAKPDALVWKILQALPVANAPHFEQELQHVSPNLIMTASDSSNADSSEIVIKAVPDQSNYGFPAARSLAVQEIHSLEFAEARKDAYILYRFKSEATQQKFTLDPWRQQPPPPPPPSADDSSEATVRSSNAFFIASSQQRSSTFSKRRATLMKNAALLSRVADAEVFIAMHAVTQGMNLERFAIYASPGIRTECCTDEMVDFLRELTYRPENAGTRYTFGEGNDDFLLPVVFDRGGDDDERNPLDSYVEFMLEAEGRTFIRSKPKRKRKEAEKEEEEDAADEEHPAPLAESIQVQYPYPGE